MSLKIVFIKDDNDPVGFDLTDSSWCGYLEDILTNIEQDTLDKDFLAGITLLAYGEPDSPDDVSYVGGFDGRPEIICDMQAQLLADLALQSSKPKIFCGLLADKALVKVDKVLRSKQVTEGGIIVPEKKLMRS